MKKGQKQGERLGVLKICPCGKEYYCLPCRAKRSRCCSKKCQYKYARRPSGLNYKIVAKNKGWFFGIDDERMHHIPKGVTVSPGTLIKKGQRISPATEFKKGQVSHNFKGNEVGYYALHTWVRRHFGKPTSCEICVTTKRLCWASKNWNYSRAREDWWMLCSPCNSSYDAKHNWGAATEMFPELRK